MVSTRARWIRPVGPLVGAVCLLSTAPAYASGSTAATTQDSGPVNVLYAGSLVETMEQVIGPRFEPATGYTFTGFSAGSDALATQIKDGVHEGDVFVSASPAVNQELEGTANGNWVSWYITFATAPLVIGYYPNSQFAHDLRTKPWPDVAIEPGFLLGRTDPATDPKGKLAVTALQQAAKQTSCRRWLNWPPPIPGSSLTRHWSGDSRPASSIRLPLLRRGEGGRHPDYLVGPDQTGGDLHGDRAEPRS